MCVKRVEWDSGHEENVLLLLIRKEEGKGCMGVVVKRGNGSINIVGRRWMR